MFSGRLGRMKPRQSKLYLNKLKFKGMWLCVYVLTLGVQTCVQWWRVAGAIRNVFVSSYVQTLNMYT